MIHEDHRGLVGHVYDISTPASPTLLYSKTTFNSSIIGVNRFTTGGQAYLAYTTNGGTQVSLCNLINL